MDILLSYLIAALFVSFVCSMLEAILLTAQHSYLNIQMQEGKPWAALLLKYKEDLDTAITAILTFNTFAHTIGAAGVGAQAQILWGNEYLSLVSFILTMLILILSEIYPKVFGANYWKQLSPFAAYTLRAMIFILKPLLIIVPYLTKFLKKEGSIHSITRQDFSFMTELGEKEGILHKDESKIIKNLLRFNDILVEDIMTPRPVVVSAEENSSVFDFYSSGGSQHFTRIPIYQERKDNISGYVLKEDLLLSIINEKKDAKLKDCKRDVLTVAEEMPLPELFGIFMNSKEHIAVVVDEYGGLAGVVSMEDVIETLLGIEITDEFDNAEDMQLLARRNWETRAKKMGIIGNDDSTDELKHFHRKG